MRIATAVTFGVTFLVILLVIYIISNRMNLPAQWVFGALKFGPVILACIPFLILNYLAGSAPEQQLSRSRSMFAPAFLKEEASRNALQRLNDEQLAIGPLVHLLLLMPRPGQAGLDVLHGWGRLWWLLVAAFIILASVQAYQKWSSEQR